MTELISSINGLVWGPPMLILIAATGAYLMLGLRGYPLRQLIPSLKQLIRSSSVRTTNETTVKGDISSFQALMTSLSATIGTGNIAGVATAIALGGPGALFWMWMIALVGMATKYAEAVLAVEYRQTNPQGRYIGGPMYYIKNGLGKRFHWLATAFALFGMVAGFGIGNSIQANSVADALNTLSDHGTLIPEWLTGVILALLVGLVILGGIKRIAEVAGVLVPFMAVAYILACLVVLALAYDKIPQALGLVLHHAFNPVAATGGFLGATVWAALRYGVARGIFSNEAGLGSAPIAHAAAKTQNPVQQGRIAMLGTFLDTIVICTLTGLVIIVSGAWLSGDNGAALTSQAFASFLPAIGPWVVSIGLVVFALTTMIGWSFYGERCAEYLFGMRAIPVFRILWVLAIPIGATQDLQLSWLVADTLNAMMALPNLIALLLLSPIVFRLTRNNGN